MSHTEFPTDNYYSLAGKTYYDPTEEDSGDGSQASAEEGFIKDLVITSNSPKLGQIYNDAIFSRELWRSTSHPWTCTSCQRARSIRA